MKKLFKIWAEEVPCTEFLGEEGLTDEKKKELWLRIKSDDSNIQNWIDEEIAFAETIPYKIYCKLLEDNKKEFSGAIIIELNKN